jgi:hypothetical protein
MQQQKSAYVFSLGTSKSDRVWTFLLLHVAANIILQFACAIDFVVILLCVPYTLTCAVS